MLDKSLRISLLERELASALIALTEAHAAECALNDLCELLIEKLAKSRNENEALKAIIQETNRMAWKPTDAERSKWLRLVRNQRRIGQ